MDVDLFKDIIYTKFNNNKSFVIIKTENLRLEYNNSDLIMYSIKITADAIKKSQNSRVFVIADLFNFKNKNIRLKFIIQFVKFFKKIYPDILEKCVIINATSLFYNIFTIIKPFIDKVTLKKIEVRKIKKSYLNEYQTLNILECSEVELSKELLL